MAANTVLEARHVGVRLPAPSGTFSANRDFDVLRDVSLSLQQGQCLGVVGESGCGKSTLARALLRLIPLQHGRVSWQNDDVTHLRETALRPRRRHIQFVAQDPRGSLNPRARVDQIIAELIEVHEPGTPRAQVQARVAELMQLTGLDASLTDRYPHELSGGQAQRVGIARALATRPSVLICDEPVSALDVSVQAQIVNLLRDLQRELSLALLFISHNLAVVRQLADDVLVLYRGQVLEVGPAQAIYRQPAHPYTRALLDAVPTLDRRQRRPALVSHEPAPDRHFGPEGPNGPNGPNGCLYAGRCVNATTLCHGTRPQLTALHYRQPTADRMQPALAAVGPTTNAAEPAPHLVACHFPLHGELPSETHSVRDNETPAL